MSNEAIEYWDSIGVGVPLRLKDIKTMGFLLDTDRMENTFLRSEVSRVRVIDENDNGVRWYVFDLDIDCEYIWYMIIKVIDGLYEIFIYFDSEDFSGGSRQDIFDADARCLFEPPENAKDFDIFELNFASKIKQGDIFFNSQGINYGICEKNEDSTNESLFTTIIEYVSDSEEEDNPFRLTLEFQTDEGTETGESHVMHLQGCRVSASDIEI
jgi:hypothetical protein